MLAILMALSFYLQVIVGILILIYANGYIGFATRHEVVLAARLRELTPGLV